MVRWFMVAFVGFVGSVDSNVTVSVMLISLFCVAVTS